MIARGYQAYNRSLIYSTENKEKILLMLYEGAIRFVRFARNGIEKESAKIRGENISKTLAILTELDCALDREIGGELAENLSALYHYIMGRLTIANTKNDSVALDEVERLLCELKEGFDAAVQKDSKKTFVQPDGIDGSRKEGGISIAV